jgi:hypothetical protein
MMKKLLVLAVVLISTSSAFCTELFYDWKPNGFYTFEASAVDNINVEMAGMMSESMNMEYHTRTKFTLLISTVDANGTATGSLYLHEFSIVDHEGYRMASMNDIPKSAIVSDVTVDRKGNFIFKKEIYMVMTETSNVLVSASATASASPNGVSASGTARAGGQELNVYAEFDPKSGAMKAGYSVKTVATTKKVKVEISADDPTIDILPYKFLELLALPDGHLNAGDEVAMAVATQKINFKVLSMVNGEAKLQTTLSEDKDASATSAGMEAKSPANGIDMGMEMDMGDMEGEEGFDADIDADMREMEKEMEEMNAEMGMDTGMDMGMTGMPDMSAMGMPGTGANSVMDMMPVTTGTINGSFNYNDGMFQTVGGTITTSMNAMGMKMNVKTTLKMKLL